MVRVFTKRVTTEPDELIDEVALEFDVRQKSRFRTQLTSGEVVGVDLPRTEVLKSGALIATDSGDVIKILAAPQQVYLVEPKPDSDQPHFDLLRAAYHLGNRHVPLMLTPDALYLEPDHVLEAMLTGLGMSVRMVSHPFEPETGAYQQHKHSHQHS